MLSRDLTLNDNEEIQRFFVTSTGMQPDFMQLSSGSLSMRIHTIDLDGVTLIFTRSTGRQLWRDRMLDERSLHFGIALHSDGPIVCRGHDVDRADAQVWMPGEQMELLMQGPLTTLDIGVRADIVEELGWSFSGLPLRRIDQICAARLIKTCRSASVDLSSQVAIDFLDCPTPLVTYWREQVLDALDPVLQPWLLNFASENEAVLLGTRAYLIVRRAEEFFDGMDGSEALRVDKLQEEVGVPRRTLFYAFRKTFGFGPRRYYELKRLHLLRAKLRRASSTDSTVQSFARDLGFSETGRLAGLYHKHFGEYPSDTLRRN